MRFSTAIPAMVLAGGVAAALAGCGSSGAGSASVGDPSDGQVKLAVGYTATGATYSDMYVCEDEGIYKKHGLDVTLTHISDSSQLAAAIASDSVQIGSGIASSVAGPAIKGVDARFIGMTTSQFIMEMWGQKGIESPEDVKGKKIGLSSPGSFGDAAVDTWLESMGWTEDDVQKTFLKNTAAEVTALKAGEVDAIVTQPPTGTQTREFGAHKVMDFTEFPVAGNTFAAMGDYIDANPKVIEAFTKAEDECLSILHQDKETTTASIMKHTSNDDPELADYSYDFFEPIWSKDMIVDPKLIDEAFAFAAEQGNQTKPDDTSAYVENTFTQKLVDDGYVDSLYK